MTYFYSTIWSLPRC